MIKNLPYDLLMPSTSVRLVSVLTVVHASRNMEQKLHVCVPPISLGLTVQPALMVGYLHIDMTVISNQCRNIGFGHFSLSFPSVVKASVYVAYSVIFYFLS